MTITPRTIALALIAVFGWAALLVWTAAAENVSARPAVGEGAKIVDGNKTSIPPRFREWVFIGAPLTPHGLNNGKAGFPEFHHVYIEPRAYAEYKRTGRFPEGTTIVKELVLLKQGQYQDGSRDEASGRGFFADRFAGIDMMVKDSKRFPETGGWGFFNFGHREPPYAKTATAAPSSECSFCHTASATYDMVFTSFYPILGRQ